jgi:hypothetical protein
MAGRLRDRQSHAGVFLRRHANGSRSCPRERQSGTTNRVTPASTTRYLRRRVFILLTRYLRYPIRPEGAQPLIRSVSHLSFPFAALDSSIWTHPSTQYTLFESGIRLVSFETVDPVFLITGARTHQPPRLPKLLTANLPLDIHYSSFLERARANQVDL